MAESRQHRSGFGFAGLLITVGVLLLLANLGQLPDGFLDALAPLWPLLLIAIGANLVISRYRVWVGSAAALAIVGVALGVAWWQAAVDAPFARGGVVEPITVEVGDASSARIDLTVAAGELDLHAGAAGPLLIDGSLTTNYSNGALDLSVRDQAGARRIGLKDRSERSIFLPVRALVPYVVAASPPSRYSDGAQNRRRGSRLEPGSARPEREAAGR